jgi:hypothetical protein
MFVEERLLLTQIGSRPRHVAHEVHDYVAMGDVDVELVERVIAEVLEMLLHLHGDVMPG